MSPNIIRTKTGIWEKQPSGFYVGPGSYGELAEWEVYLLFDLWTN